MGMDLKGTEPANIQGAHLHLSWEGWRVLRSILEKLGTDTSEMKNSTDGEPISQETCKRWAKKLSLALKENRIYLEAENAEANGYTSATKVHVLPSKAKPNSKEVQTLRNMLKMDYSDRLSKDDKEWIQGIAEFFNYCGGCRQF